jgi:tetratricopeptide (TPR) repeat protein
MKKQMLVVCVMMLASFSSAQSIASVGSALSPTAQSAKAAQDATTEKTAEYMSYNRLATTLVRLAQETFDASLYAQAEDAVEKSLAIAPNNFDTQKIRVSILLGEHEFPAALETAQALNKRSLDDVTVYGFLTDANVELGNYDDAADAAQWMLNLLPGNLPALTRAAHLRELFGDNEGAYELMELAFQSMSPAEITERASILTQMGHLRLASGNTDAAEGLFHQALTLCPNYPLALGDLADLRLTQKRYAEAVVLLQQRDQTTPQPGHLFDLAEALRLSGRDTEAKKAFAEFETKALLESAKRYNSNRELVFYYADHAKQPAKALKIAQQEYAWRHDVYTLDAYAWALHVNRQDAEARKQIEMALAVGIRDATIFRHAGEIARATGESAAAERYLKQSVDLHAPDSERAQLELASINGRNAR